MGSYENLLKKVEARSAKLKDISSQVEDLSKQKMELMGVKQNAEDSLQLDKVREIRASQANLEQDIKLLESAWNRENEIIAFSKDELMEAWKQEKNIFQIESSRLVQAIEVATESLKSAVVNY
ncbi:hypothetical protein D3C74_295090 [compost metagenome]